MRNVKIGDVVYKNYSPATVGVVIAIETKAWDSGSAGWFTVPVLTVRKANGKIWEAPKGSVESFKALIEDHRRKLARHEAEYSKVIAANPPERKD